jgi:hypothetical protein
MATAISKVAPAPEVEGRELAVTSERRLKLHATPVSAASGGERFTLGGAPKNHRRSSAARCDIYQDDGSLQGEPWHEVARNRGRVLLLVACVALLAAPLVLLSMTVSDALARVAGQQEERQCGKVTSDWGGSQTSTTGVSAAWFCCLSMTCIGCLANPKLRRMLFFVAVAGPLALCLQIGLFASSPPQTAVGQILLSFCTATLTPFLGDLIYIASRVVTGYKTSRQALGGLAASALAALTGALLGVTLALYQLISSGAALGLSTPSLVAVNGVLYPIFVCVLKRGVLWIMRARVARDRLDYVGLITLDLKIMTTAPQAYMSFGFDGVDFLAALVVGQLLELGLTVLNARSAGAVDAVRDSLLRSILPRSFGTLRLASVGSTRGLLPMASPGAQSASPGVNATSTSVFLAIQAAYAAPGELIGTLSAAVVFAIGKGFNGAVLGKVFAMLIMELVTDELSVLIFHRYRIWVRRVRVRLPRLAVVGVVFGAVSSSLFVLFGALLVCQVGPA